MFAWCSSFLFVFFDWSFWSRALRFFSVGSVLKPRFGVKGVL